MRPDTHPGRDIVSEAAASPAAGAGQSVPTWAPALLALMASPHPASSQHDNPTPERPDDDGRSPQTSEGVLSLTGVPRYKSAHDEVDLNQYAPPPLVSPIMSRSPSVASFDRRSAVSGLTSTTYVNASNPTNVHPAPAYVASFGAAQVVGENRTGGSRPPSDDEDTMKAKNDVQFSAPALALVNAFLDHLLFSFLSTARSTTLTALRPAVTEVLKHRLARDAIASAEEELHELLAGGEDEEEENTRQNTNEDRRRWDLELVWKRTRLRVMVYMRLGEMEDDDEQRYVKEEELFHGSERRFSQTSGLVSWAAAIFLTGVLEYVAEQTLQVAGKAAFSRTRRQIGKSRLASPSSEQQQPVIVDDYDVEKVALNSTLGRLWRTWRKSLRNSASTLPVLGHRLGGLDNEDASNLGVDRGPMGSTAGGSVFDGADPPRMRMDDVPDMQYPEHVLASNIPLPIGDRQRDVDEIEVPGLSRDPDVLEEDEDRETSMARRNSFTGPPVAYKNTGGLPTPEESSPEGQSSRLKRPTIERKRSLSVPALYNRTPQPLEEVKHLPGAFPEERMQEEQKASNANMTAYSSSSRDLQSLLDKVADDVPPEETMEQKEKSRRHGLIGDTVAGAKNALPLGGEVLDRSEERDRAANQPVEEGRDIEELDRRKSLLDLKAIIAAEAGKAQSSPSAGATTPRKTSGALRGTPSDMTRTESDDSSASEKTYKLGHEADPEVPLQSVARRQHMPNGYPPNVNDGSPGGVWEAKPFSPPVAKVISSAVGNPQQAREIAETPSRTVGTTPLHPSRGNRFDGPFLREKTSAKDFLQSRSLSGKLDGSDPSGPNRYSPPGSATAYSEQTPTASNGLLRRRTSVASISGTAFTSAPPTPDKESWSAALQQRYEEASRPSRAQSVPRAPSMPSGPAMHQTTLSGPAAMEHPVVQRILGIKRAEAMDQLPVNDEPLLTSASIRGPEDFDMFGQSADSRNSTPKPTTARRSVSRLSVRGPEDFEQLVKRGDTMKYTLTPHAVRDEPVRTMPAEPPTVPSASRRLNVPPIDTSDTRTGRSPVSKQATSAVPDRRASAATAAAAAAAAATATAAAATAKATPTPTAKRDGSADTKRRSVSRPPPRNVSTNRKSGLMAREPRVMTESTRDFADFIRSTGPNKAQEVTPIINPANLSTASLNSLRSAHINGASSRSASRSSSIMSLDRERDRERTKSLTKSVMEAQNIPPVPPVPMPGKGRGGMQARGPSGASNGNAGLIDFIRSGPEEDGQRRIPRSVAPFRNTMDSDQMRDVGDRIRGEPSPGLRVNTNIGSSTSLSSAKSPKSPSAARPGTNRPSGGARAGGLPASNTNPTIHPAHSGQPQRLSGHPTRAKSTGPIENGVAPTRKRHRNKDPYALPGDDPEDSDLLTALPRNHKRQEEGLADFLNNNEPPKDNGPRPLTNNLTNGQPRSILNKSRNNSQTSLRTAVNNVGTDGRTRSMQSSTGPRPGYASSVRSTKSNSSVGRSQSLVATSPPPPMPSKKMEARAPGSATSKAGGGRPVSLAKTSQTRDLADFLKQTAPEDDDQCAPAPIVGRQSKLSPKDAEKARKKAEKDSAKMAAAAAQAEGKEKKKGGGLFGRMKGRRKTWIDMP